MYMYLQKRKIKYFKRHILKATLHHSRKADYSDFWIKGFFHLEGDACVIPLFLFVSQYTPILRKTKIATSKPLIKIKQYLNLKNLTLFTPCVIFTLTSRIFLFATRSFSFQSVNVIEEIFTLTMNKPKTLLLDASQYKAGQVPINAYKVAKLSEHSQK